MKVSIIALSIIFNGIIYLGGLNEKLWSNENEYPAIQIISFIILLQLLIAFFLYINNKRTGIVFYIFLFLFLWNVLGFFTGLFFAKGRSLLDLLVLLLNLIIAELALYLITKEKNIKAARIFNITKSASKIFIVFINLNILILIILVAGSFVHYPNTYIYRFINYGQSDVDDYKIFPYRIIHDKSSEGSIYIFNKNENKDLVYDLFAAQGIEGFESFLENTKTTSFLVLKNDELVYENYFNGQDRGGITTSFSMAKSIDSLLIGFAIEDEYIKSVDEPITNFLPELNHRSTNFQKITIKDLLIMSSGIKYKNTYLLGNTRFPWDDDPKTYYYPDLRNLALEQTEIDSEPGSYFIYNNYNPLLIGIILERSTGKHIAEYLGEKLWEPLAMEYSATWSLDSEKTKFEKMESGVNARPIDYLKIGKFMLEKGSWDRQQLISEQWIVESTQQPERYKEKGKDYFKGETWPDPSESYYAYFWWGVLDQVPEVINDFCAIGQHGQFLYISPKNNLVFLRTGIESGDTDWFSLFASMSGHMWSVENN